MTPERLAKIEAFRYTPEGLAAQCFLDELTAETFCGDDDVYDQDAFSVIRSAIATNPGRPLIFRVDTWSCGLVWHDEVLEVGNVDCGGFVVPNDKERLGTFSYRYEGDYDFINGTLRGYPEGPVWRPERIQVCRSERYE